jgi:hypothetical protein
VETVWGRSHRVNRPFSISTFGNGINHAGRCFSGFWPADRKHPVWTSYLALSKVTVIELNS